MHKCDQELRAARRQRVAERDCATLEVDLLRIDVKRLARRVDRLPPA